MPDYCFRLTQQSNLEPLFGVSEQGWIFIFGIFVATISYFTKNFIVDPIIDFRKTKGKIQNYLRYYAGKNYNKIDNHKEADFISDEFRKLSCELKERYFDIVIIKQLSCFGIIINAEDLKEASSYLIRISNSINDIESNDEKCKVVNFIKDKLKIS